MKIIFDKKVITLDEVQQAKQMQKDWGSTLDNEILENMANRASKSTGKLIKVESIEVTKNHYELTVWATVILEEYDRFIKTSFDVLQADHMERDHYDNYTRVFLLQK